MTGAGRLVDAITPWLLELGNWIFGGLIAFSLLILSALLTVGPVDVAVKVATASFAIALPLDVTGFVLLRLFADMARVSLPELGTKAFVDAGFQVDQEGTFKVSEGKLRNVALRYSYGVLALSVTVTLIGLAAALWHMAWWIAVAFVVMLFVSQVVLVAAVSALDPHARWRTPSGQAEHSQPDRPQEG